MLPSDIRFELDGNLFVWNAEKARTNLIKHGVSFKEAAGVFGDPLFVLVAASRQDQAREAAIGFSATGRMLYVVHVEVDGEFIRIISARRANLAEEHLYAD